MFLWSECHSLSKLYKIESWFLVDYFELIDSLFGWSIKLSHIFGATLNIVEFSVDPWIKHHELYHQIISYIRYPRVGFVVVLLNVSLEVDMRSDGEDVLIVFFVFAIMSHVLYSDYSCSLADPIEKLLNILSIVVGFVFKELVREEVQRPSDNSSSISQSLNCSYQNYSTSDSG